MLSGHFRLLVDEAGVWFGSVDDLSKQASDLVPAAVVVEQVVLPTTVVMENSDLPVMVVQLVVGQLCPKIKKKYIKK